MGAWTPCPTWAGPQAVAAPELVIGVVEVLPGKDDSWAGVDRQSQAVVEIHVMKPVLRHLQGGQEGALLSHHPHSPTQAGAFDLW